MLSGIEDFRWLTLSPMETFGDLMMSLVLLNRHSKILDIVESSTYNNRPGVSMQEI